MANKYCLAADVINELPSSYPQQMKVILGESQTEATYIAAWLAKVKAFVLSYSEYIDVMVGEKYAYITGSSNKFADAEATPATPAVISEICFLLTISKALSWYNTAKSDVEDEDITTNKDRADKLLEQIRKGELVVTAAGTAAGGYNLTRTERTNQMTEDNFGGFNRSN